MTRPAPCGRTAGQSLVLVAIILPFVTMFVLTCLEIGARWWEVAQVEDALVQAARSAVQTVAYEPFAHNAQTFSDTDEVTAVGTRVLRINLASVHGLADAPDDVAAQVRWTVLPKGGTCTFSGGRSSITSATPLVCAELRPSMTGLLGWGSYTPVLSTAATLDTITTP